MNRCPSVGQLRLLLDDALPGPEAAAVEAHAAGCVACQQTLERLVAGDGVDFLPPPSCGDAHDEAFLRQLAAAPPWAGLTGPQAGSSNILHTLVPPSPAGASDPADFLPGLRAAGYEVLGLIGKGGMGVVYKARHLRLNRLVALKLILSGKHARPAELMRFRIEAEAVAALQHPNIVHLHEVGEADGCPYLALEHVEGGTLAERLKEAPFAPNQAAELVRVLAKAMDYAHRRGVVHRDLKPGNVLLATSFRARSVSDGSAPPVAHAPGSDLIPKITDFGLAKRLHAEQGQTATGDVIGTPSYMAPEQAQGRSREVGPAADVWALGAILYECLTGRPPFLAATPLETLLQVTGQEPVPLRRLLPKVPRDLETICLKCLAKEPARRYAGAEGLAEDLRRFLAGEPIRARPVSFWERGAKWARRRPAAALLAATLFLAALTVQGLILWYSSRLEDSLRQAQAERDKANEQEHLTRRGLYAAQMHLAQQALEQGQVAVALPLLENHRPTAERAEDLRGFEWYHLWGRCRQERAVLIAGDAPILASRWTPSGVRLAVRGKDDGVGIWNVTAQPGSSPKHILDLPMKLSGNRVMVVFSPDGRRVALANGTLRLWDVTAKEELFAGQWPAGPFRSVAFAPDGRTLAAGEQSGRVTLWDVSTHPGPTLLSQHRKHDRSVTALVFSPSGRDLALCGNLPVANLPNAEWPNRFLRVWEVATGRDRGALALPPTSPSHITRVAFAPDGKTLGVAYGKPYNVGSPDRLQLLDAANLKELASRSVPGGGTFTAAFSPDGRTLATGETNGTLRLWQVADARGLPALEERGTLYGHTARVWGLWFSPDGQALVSVGDDQTVRAWDLPPRPEPVVLAMPGRRFRSVALSPDGRRMAATDWRHTLLLWDLATLRRRDDLRLPAHYQAGSLPAFSPDGELVVVPQDDFTVKVWEAAGGRLRATLKGHGEIVTGTAFRPGGRQLATASKDGTVKLWDAATWQEQSTLRVHAGTAWSLAFSPDGQTLATGDDAGLVKLWDVDSGECQATYEGPGKSIKGVMTLAFAPDGQSLAAGSYDGQLRLWWLGARTEVDFPKRHGDAIVTAVFTPDGQALITGSKDGTIKLWDVLTRQERLTLKGHADQIQGLALTRDGETLASAGEDGTVRLWHAPRAAR